MVVNSARIVIALGIAGAVMGLDSASAAQCTRLPLSDVAFGKDAATNAAREKLRQYAVEIAAKRGWAVPRGFRESNETVSCEVYLNLGPLGTEYRCLVTTTFCVR